MNLHDWDIKAWQKRFFHKRCQMYLVESVKEVKCTYLNLSALGFPDVCIHRSSCLAVLQCSPYTLPAGLCAKFDIAENIQASNVLFLWTLNMKIYLFRFAFLPQADRKSCIISTKLLAVDLLEKLLLGLLGYTALFFCCVPYPGRLIQTTVLQVICCQRKMMIQSPLSTLKCPLQIKSLRFHHWIFCTLSYVGQNCNNHRGFLSTTM